jgi:hypothetical protein
MRSRTPVDVSSLAPAMRNASALPASRTNWWVGISLLRHAAIPSTNALDPLMSVRSRSKNAALSPEVRVGVMSLPVGS